MTEQQALYFTSRNENFEKAYNLMKSNYTHEQLLDMLQNGNIPIKQYAALMIETINSEAEADILLNNLTGQDGKIREAVSLKIKEFSKYPDLKKFFNSSKNYEIFLNAVIDINGNVCRNIISSIIHFQDDENFLKMFCPRLIEKTLSMINIIKDFDFQEGKYKVNKEVFKLYWYLETIYEFYHYIEFKDLKNIIILTKSIDEYTIREKTAKILTREFNDYELEIVKRELKSDKNYFVRRY